VLEENQIGKIVVDCSISIHKEIGPGLLESVYEVVLTDELIRNGLSAVRQVPIPISIRGRHFQEGFRADIIVEDRVIIELKLIEKVKRVHKKQLLSYLKLTGMKLGFLLNFGETLMKDGITRIVNGL